MPYQLPESDPYHISQLSQLSDEEFAQVKPPPLTPGAPLDECHLASARSMHLIHAHRARQAAANQAMQARVIK